ncbi:MAG: alpha/beta hydrolase [Firmicutes bacterium HGW-Firmicutes-11]|jgi:alpha-beta hydrolase superfamily lysophospholipase|nr:MAG: alpha/beta hydrolase [Firmicutes bacterium HGW-Firmicutes-11]
MKQNTFQSSNGDAMIAYWVETPEASEDFETRPRGILQIAHGMAEHSLRYRETIEFFTARGYVVCGNDHLGHGMTAASRQELGYFGKQKGWFHMAEDMYGLTLRMKETYGELPYFLLGHSMGSLLARVYLTRYGSDLNGVVLSGTSGPNPKAGLSKPLVSLISATKGEHHRSKLIYGLAFGNYNDRYEKGCDRLSWMSQVQPVLDDFRKDPLCNFTLTVAGFRDLMELLAFVSRKQWATEIPADLPVLLVSGEMDPVGDFGEGVKKVYKALEAAGCKDLTMKLYPDTRHEIFNEPVRRQTMEDIAAFMEDRLTK